MMMINLTCPCGKGLQVGKESAGQRVRCPACSRVVVVPPPVLQAALSRAPVGQVAVAPLPRPGRRARWPGFAAAGTVVLLIGGGLALFLNGDPEGANPAPSPPGGDGKTVQPVPVAQAKADTALARKAQAILQANCYRCHGKDGARKGGFDFVLDLKKLVAQEKVVPRDPAGSELYQRVTSAEEPMPPASVKVRPSKDDIATLKRWIEAGAPDVDPGLAQREFLAEADIVRFIQADLKKIDQRHHRFTRYFTITHLYNAGVKEATLTTYRLALAKLVNSLSWERDLELPQPIDPARTILRIDLRHYQWDTRVWEHILAGYPYGILQATAAAQAIYTATASRLPYVRADWFVFAASRPPLYHDVLQLPGTDQELEKLLRVDVSANIRRERVARAGFNGSGVSRNNRLIERHRSGYGAYWKSYDFAGNVGRRNLFLHPLGPGDSAEDFQHDGGEIIFSLPNGLQGYMLVDGKGQRIDKGPTNIVQDPQQSDSAVVNGISCMTCHVQGMISKADQIRDHVEQSEKAFNERTAATVRALYPVRKQFQDLLREDAARFARAVAQTGAKVSTKEPIVALASLFERELTLPLAAAEAGVPRKDFARGLARSADLARALGALKRAGGTVQRDVFVAAFPELVRVLRLGSFLPPSDGSARLAKKLTNSLGMKFVWCPPGTFLMGSPATEEGRYENETQHRVTLTRGFYLGVHVVTQKQWQAVMGNNPSHFKGDDRPVDSVSWDDCQEFCKKLGQKDGKRYRLPTEAEWEYACRAGTTTPFHFGKTISTDQANYDGTATYGAGSKGTYREQTTPVGSFPANAWGLFDMHGNVWQWCQDRYGVYPQEDIKDPKGQDEGDARVLRGGSWYSHPRICRSANRGRDAPAFSNDDNGCRVCLCLD